MSYPFAGLGSFLFDRDEHPIFSSDMGWNRARPSIDRQRPLGSATDSIVTIALGSAERSFSMYLSPDRAVELEQMVNTTADFTDWTRPEPDTRQAFLASVIRQEIVQVICTDGVTRARWRCSVSLVSQ